MNAHRSPVLVVGDALLDRDLIGDVERLVPDTAAPVVALRQHLERPGGAALAALTLARTGRPVTLAAPLAEDADGIRLRNLLTGITLLPLSTPSRTRTLTRVRGAGQTIVRYDRDGVRLSESAPVPREQLTAAVTAAAAVLVSDYGSGTMAHPVVRQAMTYALELGRPVVWDPHPRGTAPVPRVTVATPNRREIHEALTRAGRQPPSSLEAAAADLRTFWNCRAVVATDGGAGATTVQAKTPSTHSTAPQHVSGDACGAGDRFAATLAAALADGRPLTDAVSDAVTDVAAWLHAGGIAVESTPEALGDPRRDTAETVVATGGCFDVFHAGHVASLHAARQLGDRLVVLLNSDESVRRLKGPNRPVHQVSDRRRVLEALTCVDEVLVFDEDTPVRALAELRPAIWAKGTDYADARLPEAELLEQWGARMVLLPLLPDHSTTRILDHGRGRPGAAATAHHQALVSRRQSVTAT